MKINLAVSELPQLAGARSGEARDFHRGLVQITHPLDVLDRHQSGARYGEPAANPHIEVCFPTVHDASLAPPGCHVVTIGARSQPYRLAEGTWPERRDAIADGIIARVDEVFPNLAGVDRRPAGAEPVRPRGPARAHRRPPHARRHGARPALLPAPGTRVRPLPHARPGVLAVRLGHPPRRRRDRGERAQLRARGAAQWLTPSPATPARLPAVTRWAPTQHAPSQRPARPRKRGPRAAAHPWHRRRRRSHMPASRKGRTMKARNALLGACLGLAIVAVASMGVASAKGRGSQAPAAVSGHRAAVRVRGHARPEGARGLPQGQPGRQARDGGVREQRRGRGQAARRDSSPTSSSCACATRRAWPPRASCSRSTRAR